MKKDKKSDTITIRLTPHMKLQLIKLAFNEERTISDLVTEAINIYLYNRRDILS